MARCTCRGKPDWRVMGGSIRVHKHTEAAMMYCNNCKSIGLGEYSEEILEEMNTGYYRGVEKRSYENFLGHQLAKGQ